MTLAKGIDIPLEIQIKMCIALSLIVEHLLGLELYVYQRPLVNRIITAVLRADGEEILVLQARQTGKTEAVTVAIITLAVFFVSVLNRGFRCGIFAPAQSQAIQVTRERMKTRMSSIVEPMLEMGIITELDAGHTTGLYLFRHIASGNVATIRSMSADKSAHVKGESLNFIIVEQVEDANDTQLKEAIFPMAAATGAPRLLSGTATSEIRCEYYYDRMTTAGEDAIIITGDEAAKSNPTYARYLEKERQRLGETSLEFRASYMLEWGITLIHFIEDRPAFLELSQDYEPIEGLVKVAGWDPAKISDYSVVTCLEGYDETYVTDWWFSQGSNLEEQVFTVINWCMERGVTLLVVDAVGIGQGVCDILENHLPPEISLLKVDMSARQQDEMFKLFDREIKTGRFHYPTKPSRARELFLQQMFRAEKKFSGRSLLVEAPKGKNMHDDFVDSGALALWGLKGETFDSGVSSISWGG